MTMTSIFFKGSDPFPTLKNQIIDNLIYWSLTYVLPNRFPGLLGNLYTCVINFNKSDYYSRLFHLNYPNLSGFDFSQFNFAYWTLFAIGNNGRITQIVLNLVLLRVFLKAQLWFSAFKLFKMIVLFVVFHVFQFHGHSLFGEIPYEIFLRVIF